MGDNYDSLYPGDNGETDGAVALIASLAKSSAGCSVLEFGIGTGRLALPLHAMGVHVTGVDSSERMVAQLRHKPRGDEIDVVLGDYRDAQVGDGSFSVVVIAFNGIFDERGLVSCAVEALHK